MSVTWVIKFFVSGVLPGSGGGLRRKQVYGCMEGGWGGKSPEKIEGDGPGHDRGKLHLRMVQNKRCKITLWDSFHKY